MSECVIRMEMPSNCFDCVLHGVGSFEDKNGYCGGISPYMDYDCRPSGEMRPSWCPIICQLPEGHGRLVDADALKEKAVHYSETEYHFDHDAVEMDDIDDAPTIVPAERSET